MKKNLLFLALFLCLQNAHALEVTINERVLDYNIDTLKFSENEKILSPEEVGTLFSDYKIILISEFDKNKKYTMKNPLTKSKKILLLNNTNRTFHNFFIYPISSRIEFNSTDKIKSLIMVYGKKNIRLKHEGGDEFEIVVK